MSINLSTYLGPWIEFDIEYVDQDIEHSGCPACQDLTQYGKFCNKCGEKIRKFFVKEKHPRISHWDVTEAIKERLHSLSGEGEDEYPEKMIYLPNVEIVGIERDIFADPHAGKSPSIEVVGSMILKETLVFEKFFSKEIEIMRNMYNQPGKLSWGFCRWWS